jgi:hypothetical protein
MYDAIIIGGGFYGTMIANYLVENRKFKRVVIIEQAPDLMTRASYHNQARIHGGYHYPRSLTTALRSRVLLSRFTRDFPEATVDQFTKLYAIARKNSKVNSRQFINFCKEIKAPIEPADKKYLSLFNKKLIEDVFLVQEFAFDALKLLSIIKTKLTANHIEVIVNTSAHKIINTKTALSLICSDKHYDAHYIFNCAYGGINQIKGDFAGSVGSLKYEITEMPLVSPPEILKQAGITVMDGPFFSLMPFPARQVHSLSHVRYTPHTHWTDNAINPYELLKHDPHLSQFDRMVRDCSRYLPILADLKYVDSLWEIKTVLLKNENDDGRPILFEKYKNPPNCYTILGGKIDNIYDILERLDAETLALPA